MAAHEGALLLPRQEEGEEEGADRERHTGNDGRSVGRAVSSLTESFKLLFSERTGLKPLAGSLSVKYKSTDRRPGAA